MIFYSPISQKNSGYNFQYSHVSTNIETVLTITKQYYLIDDELKILLLKNRTGLPKVR